MSKREFVTATVNSDQAAASLERIAARVAEMLAPSIAEAVTNELKTNASSNGRKLNPSDITSRHFQGLPKGDHWDDVDLNEPIGEEPPRYTPTDGYELPD